jgi:hypothetical protein
MHFMKRNIVCLFHLVASIKAFANFMLSLKISNGGRWSKIYKKNKFIHRLSKCHSSVVCWLLILREILLNFLLLCNDFMSITHLVLQ